VSPPLRVPLAGLAAGERLLPEDTARYVSRVHRLGVGAALALFDPEAALEADGTIVAAAKDGVRVSIGATRATTRRPAAPLVLLQALGKGDKLDAVLRDATELGATAVVVVATARSVPKVEASRQARWQRIATEAARQCERGDRPALAGPISLAEALARRDGGDDALRLCLDPRAERTLRETAEARPWSGAVVLIGPEGGLTDDELAQADAAGFQRVSFGAFVLRTETAATAVLGALIALGDLTHANPPSP
jgi:16S rRNA (uracil1498-N3)-methyltransferase